MQQLTHILCTENLHLGRLLDPITQDRFFEDHVLFDDYTGVVLETDEGDRIAAALGENRAATLRTTVS